MGAAPEASTVKILFDARELYFLTQYIPVFRALLRRGVASRFVGHGNRASHQRAIERAFEALELPTVWMTSRDEAAAFYRAEAADWILFGREHGYANGSLPERTRTGMLYHGTAMKTSVFHSAEGVDVRFVEGAYYQRRLRELQPEAELVKVGYPKIDPLFWPEGERPVFDVAAAGLDPGKPTLLYAPTHAPSSFPRMDDRWPEHFSDFNLIVKAHELSFFGGKRRTHRRKMEVWSRYPNVYVAPIESFDAVPFMNAADLMVSDLSAIVFEFAATGKPVVQCDFVQYHWTRRGPLRYRQWKRLDREVVERYHDIAVHARRYRDLRRVVDGALAEGVARARERVRMAQELVGPTDGRSSERVADFLLGSPHKEPSTWIPRSGLGRTRSGSRPMHDLSRTFGESR